MNQQKKKIFGAIAGVLILIVGYFTYEYLMYVETDNAQVEAHTVMLAAKVSGFIVKVNVTDGQKVKKGDVLVEIDNRDYKAVEQSAESELQSLEARKKDAERNYNRVRQLHNENVVSAQQFDSAQAAYNEVKAKYDSAFAKLTQTKLNFENTQILAPADGVIAKKSAEVGQLAAPGTPLIGFVSSESRWVTANFKETDIKDIRVGQKVSIHIDALPRDHFIGEVETVSPSTGATFTLLPPDNATGNFTKVVQRIPVKIKFVNLEATDIDRIQAGLSTIVKVHIR